MARGTPSHNPFWIGFFHDKPTSYWGIPIYGNPHMEKWVEHDVSLGAKTKKNVRQNLGNS